MELADELVAAYLSAADARLPGLVTGVYGYGSLVLDDWRPGTSDVDLLVLSSRALDVDDLAALAEVHAAVPEPPQLEVIYVPRAALAADPLPDEPGLAPYWLDGALRPAGGYGPLNPVVWLQVTRRGRIFRGEPLAVSADPGRVRAYNLDNLRSYWQAQFAAPIPDRFAGVDPATEFDATMACWVVLGPPRLHYTLATGDVTSKSGAGRYLAGAFPRYADLAGRAVAARAGEPAAFTVADALLAGEMIDELADDAWLRWG
jgi:hypothetical protein